jgi:2-hydroxychromene-2-carboxylate isomerase
MDRDLARYARRYGVPLATNPHFPIITLTLMRAITGVQMRMPERYDEFVGLVFRAIWVDALNLNDMAENARMLAAGGYAPEAILALAGDAEVKSRLRATTDEAVARGAFGAPTMFVGGEMYFGQDRLEFVREALLA